METLILDEATRRAYLTTTVWVTCQGAYAILVYATPEGYFGVRRYGETRVDEYPAQEVTPL